MITFHKSILEFKYYHVLDKISTAFMQKIVQQTCFIRPHKEQQQHVLTSFCGTVGLVHGKV
jgi:hypothetical protein